MVAVEIIQFAIVAQKHPLAIRKQMDMAGFIQQTTIFQLLL